ncbi:RNA-binding protein Musashi homolog Rbp6 [Strongyloides ratti]|uniref:RNA-binding protein Musashi homolog Rbp6 n=1 Tax=Strongyloides ratti TaxID=34506 RepID=A0A090LD06_STRRB|nr:RNA-binding protein Musashi homolog Rbp6 [Strongyloides ratti]CEF66013.1 RNA-binding protein Musashi homolog Rbp6 [Strongyloides ratti]
MSTGGGTAYQHSTHKANRDQIIEEFKNRKNKVNDFGYGRGNNNNSNIRSSSLHKGTDEINQNESNDKIGRYDNKANKTLNNINIHESIRDDIPTTPTTFNNEHSRGDSGTESYHPDNHLDSDDDNHNNDPRKMFIGGLSWQTTPEKLREYFGQFGEINECMVMRDPQTKRARGFGFITFVNIESVNKVLKKNDHELDNKKIDPKVAYPKKAHQKLVVRTKKIFIGGLGSTSTRDDLKEYFEQYGEVKDTILMYDKSTQRHRGFGFITFESEDVADKVCEIHFHEINGKMVECKKAQPKEIMLPVQINKTRAAAARNVYGLAPEQLLALQNMNNWGNNMPFPNSQGPYPLPYHALMSQMSMSPQRTSPGSYNDVNRVHPIYMPNRSPLQLYDHPHHPNHQLPSNFGSLNVSGDIFNKYPNHVVAGSNGISR